MDRGGGPAKVLGTWRAPQPIEEKLVGREGKGDVVAKNWRTALLLVFVVSTHSFPNRIEVKGVNT